MNLVFVWITGWLVWQHKQYLKDHGMKMMEMESGGNIKKTAVIIFIIINVLGLSAFVFTQFA